ncbi:hypothetical protein [Pontibacter sp. G13]|uniref:hypothetical protein n=1 Tax=Pontibacter sp. G13 TaxID=3074898 RepID=UPI00288B4F72|nr:hypothetical protein [Pontibacter sp. G13]WNJ16797.1 hypothetical protein RJD25_18165 [Pontibacter sp. G13]
MSRVPVYEIDWLEARWRFDHEARDQGLIQHALAFLAQSDDPHIIDLGSGYGANFRHLHPEIPYPHRWSFVERDERLLAQSLQQIKIELALQATNIQVEGKHHSLLDPAWMDILNPGDLVTANAVIDILPESEAITIFQKILERGCAFLATINYLDMAVFPAHPLDEKVIGWYHQHMRQVQSGGGSMGNSWEQSLVRLRNNPQIQFLQAPSIWEIQPGDQAIQSHLLGFMEEAIGEMGHSLEDSEAFQLWLTHRIGALEAGKLSMRVFHQDFLALPS